MVPTFPRTAVSLLDVQREFTLILSKVEILFEDALLLLLLLGTSTASCTTNDCKKNNSVARFLSPTCEFNKKTTTTRSNGVECSERGRGSCSTSGNNLKHCYCCCCCLLQTFLALLVCGQFRATQAGASCERNEWEGGGGRRRRVHGQGSVIASATEAALAVQTCGNSAVAQVKNFAQCDPPPLPPWSLSLLGSQLLVDRFLHCMHPLSLCPSLFHSCSLSHWFIFNSIFIVLKKLINYCITNGDGGSRVASINWQPPRCVWQPPMQIGVAAGSGDARSAATLPRALAHATCRSSAARPSMSLSPAPPPSTCSQRPQDVDNDTERGTHYLTTHTHQRMVKSG